MSPFSFSMEPTDRVKSPVSYSIAPSAWVVTTFLLFRGSDGNIWLRHVTFLLFHGPIPWYHFIGSSHLSPIP